MDRRAVGVLVGLQCVLLAACSPANVPTSSWGQDFQWQAQACVSAAETASDLYAQADGPIVERLADGTVDGLLAAATTVAESQVISPDVASRLSGVIDQLKSRVPLTDSASLGGDTQEQREAVLFAISEVGDMCRSVFAGFDSTVSPIPIPVK